ncbi:MAG: hypothetical protein M3Y71_09220 [Actinomycetota bacterium]|nr:hypothetical protein [Actinomycetota bacterium]
MSTSLIPTSTRGGRRSVVAIGTALALTGLACSTAVAGTTAPVSTRKLVTGVGNPVTPPLTPDAPPATGAPLYGETTGAPAVAGPSAAALRVVSVRTSAALTTALGAARAGDKIVLAAGTYTGSFSIKASGTAAHPIVVTPADGAAVTLTSAGPYPKCSATGPDEYRTVSFVGGASHWVLRGMTIKGGLRLSSQNANLTQNWQAARIDDHNWQARRSVPGSAARDSATTRSLPAWFSHLVGKPVLPSEDIQLLGNTVTGKGIFGRFARYSIITGNTVTDIACGTGPAIWFANYSHGNVISGNDVSRVAHSTASHYMQEGIRTGNGSDYNVITGNRVHDLDVGGRGITTDQDASWNLITANVVDNVDIAYNEQQSSWGNVWSYNVANRAASAGFSLRMEDSKLTTPSRDTSSYYSQISCNLVTNSPVAFQAGAVSGGAFDGNTFSILNINKSLSGYWAAQGNRWNGSSSVPVSGPAAMAGC